MGDDDTSPDREPVIPGRGPRAGREGLLGGRAAPALVVFLFAALAIINTYPLARTPASVIGVHGDAYFSVWRLAWVAHQLRTDPRQLFDGNIFYPERRTLAYSDAMLLPATVLAPLHWAGVGPLAVYNVAVVATFVLNALAAYLLASRLTRSRAAGVLAGVVFAFSPYRFEHFDHLELQFAFWMPLAALAWHRAVVTDSTRAHLAVAALASAQVLSCIYYSVFLLTWLGVLTVAWLWRTPRRVVKAVGLGLLPAAVVLAVYSLPYLSVREHLGDRSADDLAMYSATARDFLSAPATNVLYGWTADIGDNERRLFPGVIAAALVVVALWRPDRVRLLHAFGLLVALLLAVGLNGPIYGLLYEHVLPFRGLRVPARATILVLLGTSVLAAFGLARVRAAVRHQAVAALVVTALVAGASAEYLSRPAVRPVDARISPWFEWLRHQPDVVIFEWPVTVPWRLWDMIDVEYMYRSTRHWRPLVNGYSGNYPDSYIQLLLRMRTFPDTGSLEYLQRQGVTVLIVHEPEGQGGSELYDQALQRLGRDEHVGLIAQGWDAGRRISFLRLAPAQREPGS
jgi:hypothetical protein